MTTIIIQAVPAFSPLPGMIGVKMGGKPITRFEVATLKQAIDAVFEVNQELKAKKINHQVSALCYGRKPRGWDKHRNNLIRNWCRPHGGGHNGGS